MHRRRRGRPPPAPLIPAEAPRLCPLCGTKATPAATRCLVCGTSLARPAPRRLRTGRPFYPSPVFLGLLAAFVAVGAGLLGMATGRVPLPEILMIDTPTITPTLTPRPTSTATFTPTATRVPTSTPLPPIEYRVAEGDSCLLLALIHDVTVESIIFQNNLDPDCTIAVGRTILIPYPTATLPPPPTLAIQGTGEAAAPVGTPVPAANYVVALGDTCSGIAWEHGTTVEAIMQLNGMSECNMLLEGRVLLVPLPGPAPTAGARPRNTG
jgi:LysM repeat protein